MERSDGREMIRCGVSKKDDSLGWIRARPECTMTPSGLGMRGAPCSFNATLAPGSLVQRDKWTDDG